jgi:hypothetical protein
MSASEPTTPATSIPTTPIPPATKPKRDPHLRFLEGIRSFLVRTASSTSSAVSRVMIARDSRRRARAATISSQRGMIPVVEVARGKADADGARSWWRSFRLIVFDNKLGITRSLQALVTNGE